MEIEITDLSISIVKDRIRVVFKVKDESGDALMTNAVAFNLKFPENQKLYNSIIGNIVEHIKTRLNIDNSEEKVEGRAIILDDDDDEEETPGDEHTMVRVTDGTRATRNRARRPRRRRRMMPAMDATPEQDVNRALSQTERQGETGEYLE